ncbi:lipopolysaccharide transport system permease protein [Rhizobium skierniewicense]|uniref:Transport permease protein n=2 Tax=Rhizobium skierniewicense TaxID=984260 RepID=A0A7W6C849_9HYPH|nr:ABC transporter permease [Rhizobium skierniewicense]MBB3944609.1 lipopolysaccharide transport system permease protein [Rhizobium skierniewicense]NTF33466.1 ABC transporter permease [Rhizobium skierniewicense]
MKNHSVDPTAVVKTLIHNRGLLWELTKRDFVSRYKGSVFGLAWSLFNPLLMLAIYTFVFSVAFKARWGAGNDSQVNFAIVLFSGLIVHALFAECLMRAPTIIAANANYVKKVVFPLEILPLMTMGSALGNFIVSLVVLMFFCLISGTFIHPAGLLLPIILLPLLLMTLGLSWFLASLGVYLRDFAQVIGMLTTVALFLAPVFYPISALPPAYQSLLTLNPITLPVLQVRDALLWGAPLNWVAWAMSLLVSLAVFYLGFAWFQKTRRGFADVL